MSRTPPATDEPADDTDSGPRLSRAASARALDEIVAQERVRQEGRFAVLRRLREQAEQALSPSAAPAPTFGARLRGLFGGGAGRGGSSEHELRRRYEDAHLRTQRALSFAETLGELARELVAEIERLRVLLGELDGDDRALDGSIGRSRARAGDAELRRAAATDELDRRRWDERAERAARRAQEHAALLEAVRAAVDRLLRLVEGERMLLVRVDALRAEVERSARAAGERLDDLGASLRARASADDAERVIADLDRAVRAVLGALDDDDAPGERGKRP